MGADVLSPAERAEVGRILSGEVLDEVIVWSRPQVIRVTTAKGRFIAKRPRPDEEGAAPSAEARRAFLAERAALELLSAMPDSPAPLLIGAGEEVDVLVMEHLDPGPSVADVLLGADRGAAEAGLVGLAETLARLHAWTSSKEPEHRDIRRRVGLDDEAVQRWSSLTADGVAGFRDAATALGVTIATSFDEECQALVARLRAPGWWRALVHGDPCPDNTVITGRSVRLFDYEYTDYGSALLDASYVLSPFPTCWCFGRIPPDVGERASIAYRRILAETHPEAADDAAWTEALAAALGSWILARGRAIASADREDTEWGTTTMRPRLVQWMDAFLAMGAPNLPAVNEAVEAVRSTLEGRWLGVRVPDYPALLTPGDHPVIAPPTWWAPWDAGA